MKKISVWIPDEIAEALEREAAYRRDVWNGQHQKEDVAAEMLHDRIPSWKEPA